MPAHIHLTSGLAARKVSLGVFVETERSVNRPAQPGQDDKTGDTRETESDGIFGIWRASAVLCNGNDAIGDALAVQLFVVQFIAQSVARSAQPV